MLNGLKEESSKIVFKPKALNDKKDTKESGRKVIVSFTLNLFAECELRTFFCDRQKDVTVITRETPDGVIRSVYEDSGGHYSSNMKCVWLLDSGSPSWGIAVSVVRSSLQWAPETAICQSYDYAEIQDG